MAVNDHGRQYRGLFGSKVKTFGVSLLLGLLLLSCTPDTRTVVREEMMEGDRQKEWALVYYHSWRNGQKPGYMRLARRYMRKAIRTYFALQMRIEHSYPDFYIIDDRRRLSCRFLDEMNRKASMYSQTEEDEEDTGVQAKGCFYRPPPMAMF